MDRRAGLDQSVHEIYVSADSQTPIRRSSKSGSGLIESTVLLFAWRIYGKARKFQSRQLVFRAWFERIVPEYEEEALPREEPCPALLECIRYVRFHDLGLGFRKQSSAFRATAYVLYNVKFGTSPSEKSVSSYETAWFHNPKTTSCRQKLGQ